VHTKKHLTSAVAKTDLTAKTSVFISDEQQCGGNTRRLQCVNGRTV